VNSGGRPKDAQVQSYSPSGTNVPSWEDTLPPPGEYDSTILLRRRCALCQITLTTCYFWTRPVAQIAEHFELNTVLWAFHSIQPSCFKWKCIYHTWYISCTCWILCLILPYICLINFTYWWLSIRHCFIWLQFTCVVDDVKCIVVTRVSVSVCLCVCVCLSVCLSAAACPHYCTDPDVAWGTGRGCPLVVHCL